MSPILKRAASEAEARKTEELSKREAEMFAAGARQARTEATFNAVLDLLREIENADKRFVVTLSNVRSAGVVMTFNGVQVLDLWVYYTGSTFDGSDECRDIPYDGSAIDVVWTESKRGQYQGRMTFGPWVDSSEETELKNFSEKLASHLSYLIG